MKKRIREMRKKVRVFLGTFVTALAVSCPVYAGEPVIVSGTKNLLAWATGIITAFVAGYMTYCASKPIIKYMDASPEEKPKFKKEAKDIIIAGVVVATLGSTITFILAKYGA